MTKVSKGVQNFQKMGRSLLKEAAKDGKNITKAQVTKALGELTADGKVGKADKAAAEALLEQAPLTAGAKEALENFIASGSTPHSPANNALNARLRYGGSEARGGGESGRSRGGSESGGTTRRRRGGSESSSVSTRPSRGGGEVSHSRPSRGGSESGGGGYSGGWGGGSSWGGGE